MDRKESFKNLRKNNPVLANIIRGNYKVKRFNEELKYMREDDELTLKMNLITFRETGRVASWY